MPDKGIVMLTASHHRSVDTVVVLNETQAIEHDRLFEELRLLSNFRLNDRFLLTLVLLGKPELRGRIARIWQRAQRVAVQQHIRYLSCAEKKAYILARLAAAGGESSIFSPGAISPVHHRTGGVCRMTNSLCDLCLYFGRATKASQTKCSLADKIANEALDQRDNTCVWVMS
jgi:type II secretory pathway predicted ATPase ExeA